MKTNLRELATLEQSANKAAPMSGRNWGYVFALFGTILFSSKVIFVKLAYQPSAGMAENQLEAITIMALRLGFSAPFYFAILFWVLRRRRSSSAPALALKYYGLAALSGMLGYYICAWLDIEGTKYVTAQLERLLLFTFPLFVFMFGAMFFGKPLTKKAIIAILIAYAGIAVIFTGGDIATGINVPLGSALVLSCAALFAFFQLFAKPLISRMGSPLFTCCAMLGAGGATTVHFMIENVILGDASESLFLPPRIWLLGLCLGIFSTLLPSFLVNLALARIGPQATAALGMIAPISTILLAIYILGEPFGFYDGVGTLITLVGIGLYTYWDKRAIDSPAAISPATGKQPQ